MQPQFVALNFDVVKFAISNTAYLNEINKPIISKISIKQI
ncbi:hypothetical protein AQPE_4798 [Aquipluma nitroreducens]|uniref:Uncharacterized protein n=1 Tax=Aquipluma nitroreducens TaxID=2010828 RepID=A0A5K7SH73_9BACT|nr:hypothetical protein AQPE_4798 [Aquipluma nitroreducens]